MKTLLLIRHAKSSWDDAAINDFERPLNERGKNDAPVMAGRLADKVAGINAIISSPAKRAAKTAKIFAAAFNIDKADIIFKTELYMASVGIFYDVIRKTEGDPGCIAVFSHNPGITDFANDLTEVHVDQIPTCGIFAIKADTGNWEDFRMAKKKFLFFDYPKI